jgi:hypothetical protein
MNATEHSDDWATVNADALQQHREWVRVHGTFGEIVRAWKQRQAQKTNDEISNDDS